MIDWVPVVAAVVASGALTALVTGLLRRRGDQVGYLREIADELRIEVMRLRDEVDRLHVHVSALETELVAMGGDPERVRNELRRRMGGS